MKKETFKILKKVHLMDGYREEFVEFEGSCEICKPLMIHKTPGQKKWTVTHIKSGGAYIKGLSLKQARMLIKLTKDYECWEVEDYKELEKRCYSRRWKKQLEQAITTIRQ